MTRTLRRLLGAARPLGRRARSRLGHWWRESLSGGVNLVFPPECAWCGEAIELPAGASPLCADCSARLIDERAPCERCGGPLPLGAANVDCVHCSGRRFNFDSVVRLGAYEGMLREAVLRMKRAEQHVLSLAVGDLLAERRRPALEALGLHAVVPVPMHWTRRARRGVNSAELLARRVAKRLSLPLAGHLLVRQRRTKLQADLSPAQRRTNVRGAFRARPHRDMPGARLLLVDDILTTGATCHEAARVLRTAGATSVAVAVAARAAGL